MPHEDYNNLMRQAHHVRKKVHQYKNNPAPTVPIYDLGAPITDDWFLGAWDRFNFGGNNFTPAVLHYWLPRKMDHLWCRFTLRGDLPFCWGDEINYMGFIPEEAVTYDYYCGDHTNIQTWSSLPCFTLKFRHSPPIGFDTGWYLGIHTDNTSHGTNNIGGGDPTTNDPPFMMGATKQVIDAYVSFQQAYDPNAPYEGPGGIWHTQVWLYDNMVWESHDAIWGDTDNMVGSPTYGQRLGMGATGKLMAVVIPTQYGSFAEAPGDDWRVCYDDISFGTGRGLNDIAGPMTFEPPANDFGVFVDDWWDGVDEYGNARDPSFKVEQYIPPQASFTWNDVGGHTVDFTDTSTNEFLSTSYSWTFGDGSPVDHTQNPSHTYSAAGDYTVVLSITAYGVTSTSTQIVTVA